MAKRQQNLLMVIADGEHARFVRPAEDNGLHTQYALNSSAAGLRSADRGSDHPGAAFHSGASAHHAVAPRHDPHVLAEEEFARSVAAQVNVEVKRSDELELVLVAPPHTLAILQEELDAVARSRVLGALAKDLVKVPNERLQPHLKTWVRPVHHTPL